MRFFVALMTLALIATLPASAQHSRRASQNEMERERESACKEPVRAAGEPIILFARRDPRRSSAGKSR